MTDICIMFQSGLDEKEFSDMKEKVMEQDAIIDQLQREMVELREVAANYKDQEMKVRIFFY